MLLRYKWKSSTRLLINKGKFKLMLIINNLIINNKIIIIITNNKIINNLEF